jgi:hypothetical protein
MFHVSTHCAVTNYAMERTGVLDRKWPEPPTRHFQHLQCPFSHSHVHLGLDERPLLRPHRRSQSGSPPTRAPTPRDAVDPAIGSTHRVRVMTWGIFFRGCCGVWDAWAALSACCWVLVTRLLVSFLSLSSSSNRRLTAWKPA